MKKYMFMCMALLALLFASCKNEDISISREVTFEVNPYTVVKDFAKHELNTDDLEKPVSDDKLCVHLFIYDSDGYLVNSKMDYVLDYKQTMSTKFDMTDGSYTAVAITSCVENDNNEYWHIKGTERLSNMQISWNEDNGYWHGLWELLGITTQSIQVNAGNNVITIDVKPAGSLALNIIRDIHYYNNVYYYQLFGNRNDFSFSFNNTGDFTCNSVEDSYFPQALSQPIRPDDDEFLGFSGVARYAFLIPTGRTSFRWEVMIEDDNYGTQYGSITEEEIVNIQTGKVYQFDFTVSTKDFTITELKDSMKSDLSNVEMGAKQCQERKIDNTMK